MCVALFAVVRGAAPRTVAHTATQPRPPALSKRTRRALHPHTCTRPSCPRHDPAHPTCAPPHSRPDPTRPDPLPPRPATRIDRHACSQRTRLTRRLPSSTHLTRSRTRDPRRHPSRTPTPPYPSPRTPHAKSSLLRVDSREERPPSAVRRSLGRSAARPRAHRCARRRARARARASRDAMSRPPRAHRVTGTRTRLSLCSCCAIT